jgi:hypothetical protein
MRQYYRRRLAEQRSLVLDLATGVGWLGPRRILVVVSWSSCGRRIAVVVPEPHRGLLGFGIG